MDVWWISIFFHVKIWFIIQLKQPCITENCGCLGFQVKIQGTLKQTVWDLRYQNLKSLESFLIDLIFSFIVWATIFDKYVSLVNSWYIISYNIFIQMPSKIFTYLFVPVVLGEEFCSQAFYKVFEKLNRFTKQGTFQTNTPGSLQSI